MDSMKLRDAADFTEVAVYTASEMLRTEPSNLVFFVGDGLAVDAQAMREKFKITYILVPREILASGDHWAARNPLNGDIIWSPGA